MSHPVTAIKFEVVKTNENVFVVAYVENAGALLEAALQAGFTPSVLRLGQEGESCLQKESTLFGNPSNFDRLLDAQETITAEYDEITSLPTIVDSKNLILSLLNTDDPKELLVNIQTVLQTLELTFGLWHHAEYCYKGAELADSCACICGNFEMETNNSKRIEKLRSLRVRAGVLSNRFRKAHHVPVGA